VLVLETHFSRRQKVKKRYLKVLFVALVLVIAALVMIAPAGAQSNASSIKVSDQVVLDGTVTIDEVVAAADGWIVLRNDPGRGDPGPVLGHAAVKKGTNTNVVVPLEATSFAFTTPHVFAELHADDKNDKGELGTFDFGAIANTDMPVGDVLQGFNIQLINTTDQNVEDDSVTISDVITDAPGWLVIHSDDGGKPGPVLGETLLKAGRNRRVKVELAKDGRTNTLWPMLHVDTGEAGKYEFGTVEGADAPIAINGKVATLAISTVPSIKADAAGFDPGDGKDKKPTFTASSVLSSGPGWLVIHIDDGGKPGPVAGETLLDDGVNTDVTVELDPSVLTPVLWPMLHVDTGEAGKYEFGTVEGADTPVQVDGKVVTFPVNAVTCTVTPAGSTAVNLRAEANTTSKTTGKLAAAGATVVGSEGNWWKLEDGSYVRKDVVKISSPVCGKLTGGAAEATAAPAAEATPAVTPEATTGP
jgi:hypothetical protein